MNQATLVLIKPDGLTKSLTGNILTRLSETKLEIVATKMARVSRELAADHYRHLKDKPFFNDVVKYLQGEFHDRRKVMAMVYWGNDAIKKVRDIAGATNPEEADPVSIRGSFGRITTQGVFENVIHASSDEKDAEREIKLWFKPEEIIVDLYPTQEAVIKDLKTKSWA
jgi:nucleoside-diphosphate kinase